MSKHFLARLTLIAFCLWHMTAVALYALPSDAKDPLTAQLRASISPLTRPYVLLFSQWQQWNMFAPDPLTTITEYGIEKKDGGQWTELARLQLGSFPWWRHTAQFKLLDRLLNRTDSLKPLREHFLASFCTEEDLPSGTTLLLTYYTATLPEEDHVESVSFWEAWKPQWHSSPDVTIVCP